MFIVIQRFKLRGLVAITFQGKGQMLTYYLIAKFVGGIVGGLEDKDLVPNVRSNYVIKA